MMLGCPERGRAEQTPAQPGHRVREPRLAGWRRALRAHMIPKPPLRTVRSPTRRGDLVAPLLVVRSLARKLFMQCYKCNIVNCYPPIDHNDLRNLHIPRTEE